MTLELTNLVRSMLKQILIIIKYLLKVIAYESNRKNEICLGEIKIRNGSHIFLFFQVMRNVDENENEDNNSVISSMN